MEKMLSEARIRAELKKIEEYILGDRELGKLDGDFIGLINDSDIDRSKIIRGVLKHVLGGKAYR